MNICFITVKILSKPQRVLHDNSYTTLFKISFPNKKKLLSYAIVTVYGRKSQQAFDLYLQGDYVIIEGKLSMSKNKNLIINVVNIHPAYIIM